MARIHDWGLANPRVRAAEYESELRKQREDYARRMGEIVRATEEEKEVIAKIRDKELHEVRELNKVWYLIHDLEQLENRVNAALDEMERGITHPDLHSRNLHGGQVADIASGGLQSMEGILDKISRIEKHIRKETKEDSAFIKHLRSVAEETKDRTKGLRARLRQIKT